MQEHLSDNIFPTRIQQPDYWVMISDLMSLIERIRTCMQIAADSQGCEEAEGNVVVLNDIAPQDSSQHSALNNCCLQLREALNFMLEARSPQVSR
jgi:hypothetical protein